jgi:Zn-dependent protease
LDLESLAWLPLLPLWYAAFLLSLTCHEAAHAGVARLGGDDTAYHGGQVTLNPWPHVRREPFGTVLVPLVSFIQLGWMMGWASAPYDPAWEDRHPRRAALMSAAGPAANIVLALLAALVLRLGIEAGFWVPAFELAADRLVSAAPEAPAIFEGVGRFVSVVFFLNLLLAAFNLMPFPPLDGAAVLGGLVAPLRRLYRQVRGSFVLALAGFVAASLVLREVFPPVLREAVAAIMGW